MRCLYIVPNNPISPNFAGGGSAVYYEHLHSLLELGCEVFLWHFCYKSKSEIFKIFTERESDLWQRINSACKTVVCTQLRDAPTVFERTYNKFCNRVTKNTILNPVLRNQGLPQLKKIIKQFKPDFIWAQHLPAVQIALLQKTIPVIYSHHDWLYKIKSFNYKLNNPNLMKEIEEKTVRNSSAVVTGSWIDHSLLKKMGCEQVEYIPIAYDSALTPTEVHNESKPRIVHLGGLGTTANKIGLERFFEVVWSNLEIDPARVWIIGDTSPATGELQKNLQKVTTTGFLDDLSGAMRPYDIHIIPWEHETGQRTKLIRAFSFSQAVIAMRPAVSCFPEVDDQNCVLIDDLAQMPAAVNELLENTAQRKKLGDAARKTFETHFTRRALLPRYKRVIQNVLS